MSIHVHSKRRIVPVTPVQRGPDAVAEKIREKYEWTLTETKLDIETLWSNGRIDDWQYQAALRQAETAVFARMNSEIEEAYKAAGRPWNGKAMNNG